MPDEPARELLREEDTRYSKEDFCQDLAFHFELSAQNSPAEDKNAALQGYYQVKYDSLPPAEIGWRLNRTAEGLKYWMRTVIGYDNIPMGGRIRGNLIPGAQLALWDYFAREDENPAEINPPIDEFQDVQKQYGDALEAPDQD